MYSNPPPRPPGPPLFGPWRCVGVCALALGLGIFIAAVFPVGGADVSGRVSSHLLRHRLPAQILTSVEKGMNIGRKSMKIVVWKSPKVLSSLLRRVFGVREEA